MARKIIEQAKCSFDQEFQACVEKMEGFDWNVARGIWVNGYAAGVRDRTKEFCAEFTETRDAEVKRGSRRVRDTIGKYHFSPKPHPDWPLNEHYARLSDCAERDIKAILESVAEKAAKRAAKVTARADIRRELGIGLIAAVRRETDRLIEAARYPRKSAEEKATEIQDHRKKKRRAVDDLNRELRELRRELTLAKEVVRAVAGREIEQTTYPEAPEPMCQVTERGDGLPEESGVYFVFSEDIIVYVGKSEKLRSRAKLSHEHIRRGEWLSWLVMPIAEMFFAELFYIWVYQPMRNGGKENPYYSGPPE